MFSKLCGALGGEKLRTADSRSSMRVTLSLQPLARWICLSMQPIGNSSVIINSSLRLMP